MRQQILFVDDDRGLLDGLKRLLRNMRDRWDLYFCNSPLEALSMMKIRCFDIVVSDMRMPELDGSQFLDQVRLICPNSVRIILSGQAEFNTILKALNSAHQYLAKPCSTESLISTLESAANLRTYMRREDLAAYVSSLNMVTGDSDLYRTFADELSRNKTRLPELAHIASSDVSLFLKLLQLTNSGFFGNRAFVFEPARLVSALGIELLKQLHSSSSIFIPTFPSSAPNEIKEINQHSIAVARVARELAELQSDDNDFIDACFAAGLLHDVGKLVLSSFSPTDYNVEFRQSLFTQNLLEIKEKELYGASHSEIGAYLTTLWGQPRILVDPVFYHHYPSSSPNVAFGVTTLLHIANALQDCSEATMFLHKTYHNLPRYADYEYLKKIAHDL